MPLLISGVKYFLITELADVIGVTRQTLWRWRRACKIPQGHKYRGRNIVFTEEEAHLIQLYSNRLEPISISSVSEHSEINEA